MGGHGHGHDIKIPSPEFYKVENYPELIKHQERLAKECLHDPWIRNQAWRYQPHFETFRRRSLRYLLGWRIGVPLFLLHIGYDHLREFLKKDEKADGGHH